MKIKRLGIKGRLWQKKLFLDIRNSHLKDLRNELFQYLKKLPEIVHLRNLILASSVLAFLVLVMFYQRFEVLESFYVKKVPIEGGIYREGVVGNVEKINPLFINTEAEASANRLIFSGLTRNLPNNQIEGDLAEKWTISPDKKEYVFDLKPETKWHDGEIVSVDDIIFTVSLIQNPDTRSNLSSVWDGVKMEKIGERAIKFILPSPYANFLETCSQPLLPKHLLGNIEPTSIKIAEFNLKPIGSGPYEFSRFDQSGDNTIIVLSAYQEYQPKPPYIKEVQFRLYDNYEELYNGIIRKQIDGIAQVPFDKMTEINNLSYLEIYYFYLPRYKNIQLNLSNPLLASKEIRQALTLSVNRQEIIANALKNQAMPVYSPITPGRAGHDAKLDVDTYNSEQANEILEKAGFVKLPGETYRRKGEQKLELNLVYVDKNEDIRVAEALSKQLTSCGFKINLISSSAERIQADHIRPRNFDLILLGQSIGVNSDLYSFWHSSQIKDPGLNITGFTSREVDKLIEMARKTTDLVEKETKYQRAQQILLEEKPVIYLYNPVYAFAVSNKIKGFNLARINTPVDHLNTISQWYIKEEKSD